ncbi:XdhC/CoxI family protein [Ferrimicrobium sp.]|uniref:XdhC family protein n=1 Tax=Ferrimicrobium sp. TaxID=2926050 RepID=UPI002603453F|nr:XdhC/CoxI family protein [Ferrimicrobium sp.]
MIEVVDRVLRWRAEGKRYALATVVAVEGSGPREPGAMMAVNEDGEVVGSVSGGCVEGAVVSEALLRMDAPEPVLRSFGILGTETPRQATTLAFGFSDDEAVAVGLTCGGTFHILVQPEPPSYLDRLAMALREDAPFVIATVYSVSADLDSYFIDENRDVALPTVGSSILILGDGEVLGSLGNADLDRVVARDAAGVLQQAQGTRREYGRRGQARSREVAVVMAVSARPPKMLIFGAVDFSDALAQAAKLLGYHVVVVDARAIFATKERFPRADEVVVAWPNDYLAKWGASLAERDAICILTHDPKFDVPAVEAALATQAGYVGVMGSRRTQADRVNRLVAQGITVEEIRQRVCGPIGLDIGARTPQETAVSILAEIVARRERRRAGSLSESVGPIHSEGAMTW